MELKSMGVPAALAGCAERAQAPPRVADPCTVVMFGATGDLAMRKLVPAFFNLKREGLLSDRFAVVGVGRNAMTQEMYRQKVDRDARAFVPQPVEAGRAEWLSKGASYVSGGYDDEATYRRLYDRLSADGAGLKNVLFYLATPPSLFRHGEDGFLLRRLLRPIAERGLRCRLA